MRIIRFKRARDKKIKSLEPLVEYIHECLNEWVSSPINEKISALEILAKDYRDNN